MQRMTLRCVQVGDFNCTLELLKLNHTADWCIVLKSPGSMAVENIRKNFPVQADNAVSLKTQLDESTDSQFDQAETHNLSETFLHHANRHPASVTAESVACNPTCM